MLFAAPLLKIRQKLANKRAQMMHEDEKPFLEHLEDLRDTIMRMVLTLAIAICACLAFQNTFVDIIMYPMKLANLDKPLERNVPEKISEEDWKLARTAARGAVTLREEREAFLTELTASKPQLRAYAQALIYWHAVQGMEPAPRDALAAKLATHLPEGDRAAAMNAFAVIAKAKPSHSLDEPAPILSLQFLKPAGSFMNSFKLSMYAALVVSFPFLFYFLMQFVLPGLTNREKKLLWPALGVGVGLFLAGVLFAYYGVVPRALAFFSNYTIETNPNFRDSWTVDDYTSFVCSFCFVFGLGFELPVVVLCMVKLGLLTSRTMRDKRAWAVVIITVVSAMLTPTPDIGTLLLMSGPLIVMYEGCIWIAWYMERKEARLEAEERARDLARRAAIMEDEPPAPTVLPAAGTAAASSGGYSSSGQDDPDHGYGRGHDYEHGDEVHRDGHGYTHDLPAGPPAPAAPEDGDEQWHEPGKPADRHPHHDHDEIDMEEQMEIYRREHAHLFEKQDTHPESIPVEDRAAEPVPGQESPSVSPSSGKPSETTSAAEPAALSSSQNASEREAATSVTEAEASTSFAEPAETQASADVETVAQSQETSGSVESAPDTVTPPAEPDSSDPPMTAAPDAAPVDNTDPPVSDSPPPSPDAPDSRPGH